MADMMTPAKIERALVEPGIRRRRNRDGSISYEVDYRDSDGRQRRETVVGGLDVARDFKANVRSDMARGKRIAPTTTTVAQAADAWLTAIKTTDLKPNTIDAYEDSYRVHLEPRFGRRRLDAVTVQDLAVFLADAKTVEYRVKLHTARNPKARKRPTKPYAARSIQLALTTLTQIYKHVRRFDGYAGEPPTDALLARERPKIRQRPKVVLTPEQTGLLVVATPALFADATAFLAGTGVRVGEALGLPRCELDLDNRLVTIRWTLTDDGVRDTPKWEHCIRTITINGALVARLAALKLATRDTPPDAPVFQTTAGTAMNRHNLTRRGLWVACAAAGLPRIGPHSLRHGHGSALLEQGWTLPDVSARLGHKNPRVTAEVYAHELKSLERTARQQDRLDALYGGAPASLRAV
jgi:integrase